MWNSITLSVDTSHFSDISTDNNTYVKRIILREADLQMKRIMLTMLVMCCLLSVVSCGGKSNSPEKDEAEKGFSASSLVVVYDGVT